MEQLHALLRESCLSNHVFQQPTAVRNLVSLPSFQGRDSKLFNCRCRDAGVVAPGAAELRERIHPCRVRAGGVSKRGGTRRRRRSVVAVPSSADERRLADGRRRRLDALLQPCRRPQSHAWRRRRRRPGCTARRRLAVHPDSAARSRVETAA